MGLNGSNNGKSREVPIFPFAGVDFDFGPELPIALQQLIFNWLLNRKSVVEADKNPERMASLMRGEIVEGEKAHNQGETSHLISELADIYFFLDSFRFGLMLVSNGQIPALNTHWIHAQSLVVETGSGVYDRLREISGDLEMGGAKSMTALEQMYIQVLALWRELDFLGDPISVIDWVAKIKNPRNLPAETVNGLDPFSGESLQPHERRAQRIHAMAILKLLRDSEGRPESGLSPSLYSNHRHQVLNFRDGEVVLDKLSLALTSSNGNGVK